MEHKAFAFDYDGFERELRPLLQGALVSESPESLVAFIKRDLARFCDPYEGDQLQDDWENLVEAKDVHQYGDFALTKYYNPAADIGLGSEWEEIRVVVERELGTSASVLGRTLAAQGRVFDPGKMGSYFQSRLDIERNIAQLERLDEPRLKPLAMMLDKARAARTGLYVTF